MDIGDSIAFYIQLAPPPREEPRTCDACHGSGEVDAEVQMPGDAAIVRVLVDCACKGDAS